MGETWEKTWTTRDEIIFVRRVGTFKYKGHVEKTQKLLERKLEILKKYLIIAKKRQDWGNINKDKVLKEVLNEIDRVEKSLKVNYYGS